MTSVSKDETEHYASAGSLAEEVLSSVRTVVAFGGQQKEVDKYAVELKSAQKNAFVRGSLAATTMGLTFGIIYGMYGLGLWYGVKIMLDDRETGDFTNCTISCQSKFNVTESLLECVNDCYRFEPGSIVVCVFGVLQGGMGIGQSGTYVEAINLARAAAFNIYKVIGRQSEIDSSSNAGEKPRNFEGNIGFVNVSFNYPSRKEVTVLKNLNLEIPKGKTVALVGSSGCGKSTCIQLLQRFYDPDSGAVLIDGNNMKDLNVGWLRDHIGIVGQEPVLFDTTIRENISYAKSGATEAEIIAACKEASAWKFIEKLPNMLDTLVGEGGTQLSGGQKQRIAIARALVRNPRLLLLDEATSALDTQSEALVQAALDKINENKSRTTIVVAHRLSTIRNSDIIVAFEEGRVKEKGSHEELMEMKGLYYSLVERQTAGKDAEADTQLGEVTLDESNVKLQHDVKERFDSTKKTNDEKEKLKKSRMTLMRRLLAINMPELPWILIGILSAILFGGELIKYFIR